MDSLRKDKRNWML